MNAKIKHDKLLIELDLHAEKLSSTGKTIGIAGTGGRWRTNVNVDGQPVWVIANAFMYPKSSTKQEEPKGKGRKVAAKPADNKRKPVVIEEDDEEEEDQDDEN